MSTSSPGRVGGDSARSGVSVEKVEALVNGEAGLGGSGPGGYPIINNITTQHLSHGKTLHPPNSSTTLSPNATSPSTQTLPSPSEDPSDLPPSFFVQAQYSFTSPDNSSLSFTKGDMIEVLTQLPSGWWDGLLGEERGWFPSNYVKRVEDWQAEEWFAMKEKEMQEEREREMTSSGLAIVTPAVAVNGHLGLERKQGEEDMTNTSTSPRGRPQFQGEHLNIQNANALDPAMLSPSASEVRTPFSDFSVDDPLAALAGQAYRRPGESSSASRSPGPSGREQKVHGRDERDERVQAGPSREMGGDMVMVHSSGPGQGGGGQGRRLQVEDDDDSSDGGDVEDFWVPSLTDDGQIFYHNTKTQQTSWDLPENTGIDSDFDTEEATFPPTVPPRRTTSNGQPIPPRSSSARQSLDLKGFPKGGDQGEILRETEPDIETIEGDDDDAAGMSDDGDDFSPYGLRNRLNAPGSGKARDILGIDTPGLRGPLAGSPDKHKVLPPRPIMERRPSERSIDSGGSRSPIVEVFGSGKGRPRDRTISSTKGKARLGLGEALKAFGINRNASLGGQSNSGGLGASRGSNLIDRTVKRLSGTPRSETSGFDFPESRVRSSVQSTTSGRSPSIRQSRDSPLESPRESRSRNSIVGWEEDMVSVLNRDINDDAGVMGILDCLQEVKDALAKVEAVARDFESGRSEVGRFPNGRISTTPQAVSLRQVVKESITPIRDLVHMCRHAILGLPAVVTETLNEEDLQQTSAGLALSYLSHEGLHPAQRRIVASLSKVVFFAHSAAGMDWPIRGCAEKLVKDLHDVQASIDLFVQDVKKIGCLSAGGRGVRKLEPDWAFGEMAGTRKREWRRLDAEAMKLVTSTQVEIERRMADILASPATNLLPGSMNMTDLLLAVERLGLLLKDLDIAATLDMDYPKLTASVDMSAPGNKADYNTLVERAIHLHQDYQQLVSELNRLAGDMLAAVLSDRGGAAITSTIDSCRFSLAKVPDVLDALARLGTSQAEIVASGQLKGRIGKHSRRVADRERLARRMRSSSRSSSLTSLHHLAPKRDTPRGVYDGEDDELLRSQDGQTSRPQSTTHTRQKSGGPTVISASSSNSNLSYPYDGEGSASVRSSTSNLVRAAVPFLRNRSVSDHPDKSSPMMGHKKKLEKWLGDDVQEAFEPHPRPPAEENPAYLAVDYSEDDIIVNSDNSTKAGTLPALIERLTLHDKLDHSFNATFLMTYRSFAASTDIIDLLSARYRLQAPPGLTPDQLRDWQDRKQKPVKLRVFNIFKMWLDQHYIDRADGQALQQIQRFIEEWIATDEQVKMPHQVLLRVIQRRRAEVDNFNPRLTVTTGIAPEPIIPRFNTSKGLQLLDIDPQELARQLTLFEVQLYNRIGPEDCLDKAWSRTDDPEKGANIKAMILTSNRIAGWVAEAILSVGDAKRRAQIMKHFLLTAEHCRKLNNFSSMAAIMAGLNSTPIIRLKRTREFLNAKTLALLDSLDKTLDLGKNFAGYRELLKRVNPPCIPFLGAYLTFLTFIEDGNADMIPSATDHDRKLIHFAKRQKCADVIREIQQYQATPYTLKSLPMITQWLHVRLESVEKGPDLYELSLKLEPREREDEKIARMLRESGMI